MIRSLITYKERSLRKLHKIAILICLVAMLATITTGCFGSSNRPLGWSGVTVSGNFLYFGTHTGTLISLNKDTGAVQWQLGLSGAQGIYGSPLVVGDTIYVTTHGGRVFAVNTSGVLKWTSPSTEQSKSPDAIISGLGYSNGKLFFGSTDKNVYALDASTGQQVWKFATGDKIWASPVVDNGVVYIGSFDNSFYALSAEDGRQIWKFDAEGVFTASSIISGNTVIVGSLDRNMYAIDKNSGSEIWRFTAQKWFWANPILVGSSVYAPNTDGKIYVLKSSDGQQVGVLDLGKSIASSPALADDQVVVATEAGIVSTVDKASQQVRQIADLQTTIRAPITANGEVIYLHSQTNETIYALNAVAGTALWQYRVQ
jgi:eukaryotic-like serine/threonine-protein kinase